MMNTLRNALLGIVLTILTANHALAQNTPQIDELLGVLDGIAQMGQAAHADAQRRTAQARREAQLRQLEVELEQLIAQFEGRQPQRQQELVSDGSGLDAAVWASIAIGIERNQRMVDQWMSPINRDIGRILNGSDADRAEIARRYERQAAQLQGPVHEQQQRHRIREHERRVQEANRAAQARQDADRELMRAQALLNANQR